MDISSRTLLLLGLGSLFACEDERTYDNSCGTAEDGVCDELVSCPLGSDSRDCDAACAEETSEDIVGVCSHDLAILEPDSDLTIGVGSEGTGGLIGTWDGTITARGARSNDSVERHFRVYVPRRYNEATPTPILFALGGFSVDMYWLAEFTELNRMADREDFIVVYGHPEWRDYGSFDVFSWYVYTSTFQGDWADNPDIDYLEQIINQMQSLYNIDTQRIYVSGHSRGAALSIIAAFERPDLFAGWCAQAGFISANEYSERLESLVQDHMVPGVLVHGEDDPDVGVINSDRISAVFSDAGQTYAEDWSYIKIPNATHEWQSQYNQRIWDFLSARPNRLVEE